MVNPGTKYLQIAADLRARIATGALRPGDPVPSEADLAAQWGVARMTARAALLDLERAGLLTPGRPRTVARYEPLTVHVNRRPGRRRGTALLRRRRVARRHDPRRI
jgi:DNA-binding FadR family transcriptional regulator